MAYPIPEPVARFNLKARGQAGADWLARLPGKREKGKENRKQRAESSQNKDA